MHDFDDIKHPERYEQNFKAFALACNKSTKPAPEGGWCVLDDEGKVDPGSLPPFNRKLLFNFAAFLMDDSNKYTKADLDVCRSSVNFYYLQAGLPAPWQGSAYFHTMNSYKGARKAKNIALGKTDTDPFRVAVPEDVYIWLLDEAEKPETSDDVRTAFTLILIGWLFGLRAGSTAFTPGDVRFAKNSDGSVRTLIVDSESLKLQDPNPSTYKQRRCPAPDAKFGPTHPRARLFALIGRMIEAGNIAISGTPVKCSDVITKWMKDLIPASISQLPVAHKITSHSNRKACASCLDYHGCGMKQTIMPHGRWQSFSSAEKYVEKGYQATRFSAGMFDWLIAETAPLRWSI